MMPDLNRPIRFLRPNRYGAVGAENSALDYGVRSELVHRRVAEWADVPEPARKPRRTEILEKGN